VKSLIFIGSLLIFLGGFWLLTNLGLISAEFWGVFWPVVLILLGIKVLVIPLKWHRFWDKNIPWREAKKKIKIE